MTEGMTVADAKKDFDRGLLKGFAITKMGMSHDWMVVLRTATGDAFLVEARTKGVRAFKTIDAAANAIQSIGFHVVSLAG